MDEKFPISHIGPAEWMYDARKLAIQFNNQHWMNTRGGERGSGWGDDPLVDKSHGLHWFTLPPIGDLEVIGFIIHHDQRVGGDVRAEAYLRLAPQPRHNNMPYESKADLIEAHKKQKVQRLRKSRQIIGRSHRRF